MGSRHGNKKLRNAVKARMAATGETYQRARTRILEGVAPNASGAARRVDLISISYWGRAATLATFEIAGRLAAVLVAGTSSSGPFPRSPVLGLSASGLVH